MEDYQQRAQTNENLKDNSFEDFRYVNHRARVAVYDDFKSAPHVIEIDPDETQVFISRLSEVIYDSSQKKGGSVPFTIIHEVAENFIHARFQEIVVSIFDNGNTISFADQGPGITDKEKAQRPGFSSAIEPMKSYIRGVGSGFPIVKEYLEFSHGNLTIEDNLDKGSVITISVKKDTSEDDLLNKSNPSWYSRPTKSQSVKNTDGPTPLIPPLSQRERILLGLLYSEGVLGITNLSELADLPASSTHASLKRLEEEGLVQKTVDRKRALTDLGEKIASSLDNLDPD